MDGRWPRFFRTNNRMVPVERSVYYRVVERQTYMGSVHSWRSLLYRLLVLLEIYCRRDWFGMDGKVHWVFCRFDHISDTNLVPVGRVNVYAKDHDLFQSRHLNYFYSTLLLTRAFAPLLLPPLTIYYKVLL